jgi:transmembrane sensor
VVRCERGLTSGQETEFAAWIGAHPQHRVLFEEFGGTWNLMGRVAGNLRASPARRTNSRGRARKLRVSLAVAAGLALAVFIPREPAHNDLSITTDVGASRKIELADGSVVKLNTDSSLATAFGSNERRVRLAKGEAFFQVAKDARRPFVVEASGVGVRALGTAFNVRVRAESVEVLVTEGRVRVTPEPAAASATSRPVSGHGIGSAEVGAGERVIVSRGAVAAEKNVAGIPVARMPAEEMRRALAWQAQRLDFSDTPLSEMVAEFNRYNRHQLTVSDPEPGARRFGGSFRADDWAGFVRVLRENFGMVAEERDNQTVLRPAP